MGSSPFLEIWKLGICRSLRPIKRRYKRRQSWSRPLRGGASAAALGDEDARQGVAVLLGVEGKSWCCLAECGGGLRESLPRDAYRSSSQLKKVLEMGIRITRQRWDGLVQGDLFPWPFSWVVAPKYKDIAEGVKGSFERNAEADFPSGKRSITTGKWTGIFMGEKRLQSLQNNLVVSVCLCRPCFWFLKVNFIIRRIYK